MHNVTRRPFAKLSTIVAAIALGLIVTSVSPAAERERSASSERRQTTIGIPGRSDKRGSDDQKLGSTRDGRIIVPVSGGTFAGPRFKGTIIPPEATDCAAARRISRPRRSHPVAN